MQASVKQDRQKWIGGSDIPAIMGISPFTTRYDLLLYKAGITEEQEFEGNEYTAYGNTMEPKIRDYINEGFTHKFVEGKHEDEKTGFRCHTDGETDDTILEIKTTSQIYKDVDDYKVYLVQLLFYMMNTNRKYGILAVYERPADFSEDFDEKRLQTFEIDIDDYEGLCNEIMDAVDRFDLDKQRLIENPLLTEQDLLPTPVQELSNEIEQIENQLVEYKELEKKQKTLKEKLFEQMEAYGIKKWETPNGTLITRVEGTPDKTEMVFNEDKFKEEQPVVYASYSEEKLKKGRSGYVKITLRD